MEEKITMEQVEHVARLARLHLSEEEKKIFSNQLNQILSYMEKLNELDTSGVEPTSHVLPISNVFKDDAVEKSIPLDEALANAPQREEGFYRVPRVIE